MFQIKRNSLLAVSLAGVLIIAACGGNDENSENNGPANNNDATNNDTNNTEETTGSPHNLEEMEEDDPVALVNGEAVTKRELNERVIRMLGIYAQQGVNFEDEESQELIQIISQQELDTLITMELLSQEADKEISPDEEEVNSEFEQWKSQFENEEEYEENLEQLNYTEEEIREILEKEIKVLELLTLNHLDDSEYEVTEEEVREFYEQMAMQDETIGDFEDERDNLEEGLRQQQYVEALRENADIEILI